MSRQDVEQAIEHVRNTLKKWDDINSWSEMPTRYVLIDPVMKALGWDYMNPYQCNFEHPRTPKGQRLKKVDYAFFHPDQREYADPNYPNRPVILLEAKALYEDLEKDGHVRQLRGYVNVAPRINEGYAVLTNGKVWQLYNLSCRGSFTSKSEHTLDVEHGNRRNHAGTLLDCLGAHKWWP